MGTIDDYLADLGEADREVIERVYRIARDHAPEAEQGRSYGMPALILHGKPLLAVMRTAKHIGVYPFSGDVVAAVSPLLDGHPGIGLDKGTIRFQPEHPLTEEAVQALVDARRVEIDES